MKHRHINSTSWTLAAIDSCIGRGAEEDWSELRAAAGADREVLRKVLHVCTSRLAREDPEFYDRAIYEQWKAWAEGVT